MDKGFKKNVSNVLEKKITIIILLIVVSLAVTIQNISLGVNHFWGADYNHTHYNNYVIFKYSFFHLLDHKNLYTYYLNEQADLFKYSPTFALFMGIFAYLPDFIGLLGWNLLNSLVLYFSITSIKSIPAKNITYIVLFTLSELILSIQNSQSNALLTGLTIMAFNYFEKDKSEYATLLIVLSSFIKIFSLSSCLLLLVYPKKIKSFSFLIVWFIIIGLLPLLVIDRTQLYEQYLNWGQMLANDHSESLGMSIYQFTSSIFSDHYNKLIILFLGLLVILSPLLFIKSYSNFNYRISYVCLLLIWVVVFNHKAESPTFIIALSGCAIWCLYNEVSKNKLILLICTVIFTSLFSTDLVPFGFRQNFLNMNYIKPFMSIVTLFIIFFGFFKLRNNNQKTNIISSCI